MTEELKYEVIKKFPNFEIRRYPDYALVQVEGIGEFNLVSFSAFLPLFNYISGQNLNSKQIAMTAPVLQETIEPKKHVVSFVLPDAMAKTDIPVPANSKVITKKVQSHDAAVLKFGGSWSTRLLAEKENELKNAVKAAGLKTEGNVYFARFDPPWKPWFLKRNEAIIKLASNFD